MSRGPLSLIAAVVLTAAAVAVGVLVIGGDDGDEPPAAEPSATPPPTVESTPLADYDTTTVAISRAAFCDAVPAEVVARALEGNPTETTSYGDGQRVPVAGRRDVVHEFGCAWEGTGAAARAWVFAPPVTPREARALGRQAAGEDGCDRPSDAPGFGRRSVALVCPAPRGTVASFRGLFGDAWLTCSVTARGPAPSTDDLLDRTGRWCVGVAEAARSTAG